MDKSENECSPDTGTTSRGAFVRNTACWQQVVVRRFSSEVSGEEGFGPSLRMDGSSYIWPGEQGGEI